MPNLILLALNTYAWWGPLGYFFRDLAANVVAGFVQVGIAALIASVLIPATRCWWIKHLERLRCWVHVPLLEQAEKHHKLAMEQARQHHTEVLNKIKKGEGD